MATTVSTQDIIYAALRKTGEFDQADTVPGDDYQNAELAFDLVCKEFTIRGVDLFTRDQVTLFLQKGQESYTLGATDHATLTYTETTLSADEATGQTELSVTSESGISASDNIGIKLDDNSIHWTTVSSLGTLTVADALPSAASSGNRVYAYTTKASRPQKILSAFRRDTGGIDTPVARIGEDEYYRLSDKDSSGPVNQIWYHPTVTNGTLYVWPTDGGSSVDKLVFSAQMLPTEFPVEWANALIWGLASELGPEYGLPIQERVLNRQIAEKKLQDALDYDVEDADAVFAMGRPYQ